MKDFFKTCLEELEDVAGIRQLHWLRQACEDQAQFDKRKEVLINGMLWVSQKSHIPVEDQKKIIRRMMIEDTEYDHLDSRTITRWFNLFKNQYPFITEDEMKPAAPPAPPLLPDKAQKYIDQINANLSKIGTKLPTVEEIEQGLKEVKTKETGRQKFVIGEPCKACDGLGNFIHGTAVDDCKECNGTGVIDAVEIWAMNEAEAKKAFDATFK